MSVYRDTNTTVIFEHPIDTTLSATVFSNGVQLASTPGIQKDVNDQYSVDLTYNETQYDGKLNIVWSDGGSFSRTQVVEVVTPLVPLSYIRTLFTDTNPGDAELTELENTVRVVIQQYCQQSFGWSVGQRSYVGNGTGKLILKEHCDSLTGILGGWSMYPSNYVSPTGATNLNGELNLDNAGLVEDGWSLLVNYPLYLNVKQAPPMELIDFGPAQDGTIRVPRRFMRKFDYGTKYTVTGEWGYSYVPDQVQEAAMLLANDFASNEVTYRDRYLSILKIQQDSLTYHPGAFRGTGNARADLLLGEFRRGNGMIIL